MDESESPISDRSAFDAVTRREFGSDTCFLCGLELNDTNRSDEHVIPRWVQSRFNLWNQELVLLNGTSIPYRQLTIPCCKERNSSKLAPIENSVAQATEIGADEVRKMDRNVLFLWLGKLFYGLLYKEIFVPMDRRNPSKGPILSQEILSAFASHHFFLQGARIPIQFENFFPASIFIYDLKVPQEPTKRFDFYDNLMSLSISVRLGSVGIIASLQDGETLLEDFEELAELTEEVHQIEMHPLQFVELATSGFYRAGLLNRLPKYITVDEWERFKTIQMPMQGFTTKPLYDEWDHSQYAKLLSRNTGISLDIIFRPPDEVWSWLRNENKELVELDINQVEWP
jgi:hypothetical protein